MKRTIATSAPLFPAYAGWQLALAPMEGSPASNLRVSKRNLHLPTGCFPMSD